MNRQHLFASGVLDRLSKIIKTNDVNSDVLRDACGAIRALVLDDDLRHEFGKAHEHAALLARELLVSLTGLLSSKLISLDDSTQLLKFHFIFLLFRIQRQ